MLEVSSQVRHARSETLAATEKTNLLINEDEASRNAHALGKMDNIASWYTAMEKVRCTLSGISLKQDVSKEHNETTLEMVLLETYTCTMKITTASCTVEHVKVFPTDIDTEDLIVQVKATHNIASFLVQLRTRVQKTLLLKNNAV